MEQPRITYDRELLDAFAKFTTAELAAQTREMAAYVLRQETARAAREYMDALDAINDMEEMEEMEALEAAIEAAEAAHDKYRAFVTGG